MITVVFATRNRAETLDRVLDTYTQLQAVSGGWRLIVVDNGSGDATPAVLERYRSRLPLTCLSEPRPGKNCALNAAIGHLQGDLAVFTDDDVLPAPDWLCRLADAAERHPEHDLFGGSIQPDWPVVPPPWVLRYGLPLGVLFGVTEGSEGPCRAGDVWGGNMAVRTRVFAAGHRFSEGIGPKGAGLYGMGSDTEFNQRIEAAGYRAYFVADAVVRHIVREAQLSEAWMLERAFRHGFGFPRFNDNPFVKARFRIAGLPVNLIARLAVLRPLATVARPLPMSRWRFHLLYKEHWHRGVAHHFATARQARQGTSVGGAREAAAGDGR